MVAPARGVLRDITEVGLTLEVGSVIGVVTSLGERTTILTPFRGVVVDVLAHAGDRVRKGQPVVWLECA